MDNSLPDADGKNHSDSTVEIAQNTFDAKIIVPCVLIGLTILGIALIGFGKMFKDWRKRNVYITDERSNTLLQRRKRRELLQGSLALDNGTATSYTSLGTIHTKENASREKESKSENVFNSDDVTGDPVIICEVEIHQLPTKLQPTVQHLDDHGKHKSIYIYISLA